jgi:preprotein translocase subunit Sss1
LVKTTRYKTVGSFPEVGIKDEGGGIQGLIINDVSSLNTEEKNLIKQEFPNIDFNKVLILEDGRKPTATGAAVVAIIAGVGMLGLGIVGVLGAIVLWFKTYNA